jgi:Kef-type K+ transport system membrane component KefB
MPPQQLFVDMVVIVSAAAAIAVIGRSLRLPLIPCYLAVGAVIGPHAAGLVRDPETVAAASSIAVILLMFTIGLHMDVADVRRRLGTVLSIGGGGAAAFALVGWPLAMSFGLPAPEALAVSGALAMSSTAVVLRVLQERRELNTHQGRLLFGALLVQDLLAVLMLAGVPILAAWTGSAGAAPGASAGSLAFGAIGGIGGVAAMIILGRLLLPRLLAVAAGSGSGEAVLVVSAAVALGAALATVTLGFSPELGAFLAGFLLASTPFRFQISGQLAPMRDLFMAVFFTSVGLEVDPGILVNEGHIVLLGLGAMFIVKTLVHAAAAWGSGASPRVAAVSGLSLANAGEFSIVLLAAAVSAGVVSERTDGIVIVLIVCSLVMTPSVIARAHRWARALGAWPAAPWIRRGRTGTPAPSPGADGRHIVIAGFGVVGRTIAERLDAAGLRSTVIELNLATVRRRARLGRPVVYGDVGNPEVLESARVGDADAVIFTIPDHEALFRACPLVRGLAPTALIAARTSYLSQAMVLSGLGADLVVIEEVATAEAMASQVLERLSARGITGGAGEPGGKDKAVGPA